MAVKQPLRLQPKPKGMARVIQGRNMPTLALGAIALALAILIFHDLFQPAASTLAGLRTALVSTGIVTNTVTASGSLVPAQQMNLGFKTPGTLIEVDALDGATVKAGQVLAKIDPAPLQLALQQAQASLASAEAALSQTESGTSLQQASDQLNQANQSYTNAVNNLNADQATLNNDNATLNVDRSNYWYTQYQPALAQFQNELATAQALYVTDGCNAYTLYTAETQCSSTATPPNDPLVQLQAAQSGVNCLQGGVGQSCTADQQQIASAYKAVQAAQGTVNGDQAKVNGDNLQVQNAANSVTSARDGYNSQAANRPATIQMEQSQIAAAQAQVDTAQSNLDGATLTAPVDGIITAVNAQAGDSIAANSGSSGAEAPGSTALLPSSGTGTGSGGAGGGSAFMTLVSTANYQTVVTFAESDAAKVAAGQVGQVTFDAISGLTVPVHVLAVAGSATVVSNVVNYYVTLSLDSTDPRLRPGMTTNATLITAEADNVLTVQNSALIHRGTQVFVNLLEGTKQVLTAVTVGVVGTTTTEVMTGVREGDTVVIPTVSATRSTTTLGGGGGRFGGGGAGVGVGLGG